MGYHHDGAGKPADPIVAEMDSRILHVAESTVIVSTVVAPELAAKSGAPQGPALLLLLETAHEGHRCPLQVLIPLDTAEKASAYREGLLEACQMIRDSFDDPSIYAGDVERTTELNRLAGNIPGAPRPRCPGCGSALFGNVAIRGGCLACYPDLGPLEAAHEL